MNEMTQITRFSLLQNSLVIYTNIKSLLECIVPLFLSNNNNNPIIYNIIQSIKYENYLVILRTLNLVTINVIISKKFVHEQ